MAELTEFDVQRDRLYSQDVGKLIGPRFAHSLATLVDTARSSSTSLFRIRNAIFCCPHLTIGDMCLAVQLTSDMYCVCEHVNAPFAFL